MLQFMYRFIYAYIHEGIPFYGCLDVDSLRQITHSDRHTHARTRARVHIYT